MTTLSNSLATGITLAASGSYASPFTVTATGAITAQPSLAGVTLPAGTALYNAGQITGGAGAPHFNGIGTLYIAGDGIYSLAGATLTNSGIIQGGIGYHLINGAGEFAGGYGAHIAGTVAVLNTGLIQGGAGGPPGDSAYGGDGGGGLYANVTGTITNSGTIRGGDGGTGFAGGFGGAGVVLKGLGDTLMNTGLIAGGNSGYSTGHAPMEGFPPEMGIYVGNNGVLINGGTIAPGLGAPEAVVFGGTGTLIVEPGAVFLGTASAPGEAGDVLELAGYGGALSGIGTQFDGFTTLGFAPGATGLISGNAAGLAAGQVIEGFNFGDTIDLTGFTATGAHFSSNNLILSNASAAVTLSLASEPGLGILTRGTDGDGGTVLKVQGLHNFYGTLGSVLSIAPNARYESAFTIAAGATVEAQGSLVTTGFFGKHVLQPFGAAVYGAAIAPVTLTNHGLILEPYAGTTASYYGIALAGGGAVTNQGSVIAPSAIVIYSAGAQSAYAGNTGRLSATQEYGIAFIGRHGIVTNSGTIMAAQIGIVGAETATNSGVIIAGQTGIDRSERVTNAAHGTISGGNRGIDLIATGHLIDNAGTITSGQFGIYVAASATITNRAGGMISGAYGIQSPYDSSTVTLTNAGTISGNYDALQLLQGAIVTNAADGLLTTGGSADDAALLLRGGGTLFNAGTIFGGTGAILDAYRGVSLTSYVYNSGSISALSGHALSPTFTANYAPGDYGVGIALNLAGSVVNAGFITASNAGIYVTADATITNTGTILGTAHFTNGIYGNFTGVVTNRGMINVTGEGIQLSIGTVINTGTVIGSLSSAIEAFGGSIFNSGVLAGGDGIFSDGTVQITSTGNVSGRYFGVYAYGDSVLTNAGTIAGRVGAVSFYQGFNNTLIVDPGAIFSGQVNGGDTIGGPGTSVLELGAGAQFGTLAGFGSAFINFQTLAFQPGASWDVEGDLSGFDNGVTITGLASSNGDLDIVDVSLSGAYTLNADGTLALNVNHTTVDILFSPADAGGIVSAQPDQSFLGTDFTLTAPVACFCAGTRIATPRGNIPVEKLAAGDLVKTTRGLAPIQWIGTRAYAGRFIAGNPMALPIRIRRHAIAFNIPSRDLYVSPDHAICEGGVLIHAHLLTNGVSITQLEAVESVAYFHIELENHAILFAENLPTESFIDEGARHRFANAHTAPPSRPQNACLPRVAEGFHLHNIKSRIARRAGVVETSTIGPLRGCIDDSTPNLIRGWALDIANPESPVLLEIFSGGLDSGQTAEIFFARVLANTYRPDLRAAGIGSGCHGFAVTLPNLPGHITIRRAADGATLQTPRINAA